MPIRLRKRKGMSVLNISGDMTIYTAAALKDELLAHIAKPGEREIDLSEVTEMDAAGLQLLIMAKREAVRHNQALHFSGHSRSVLEIIDLCNMGAYFGDPIWETEGG
jgi:anti-anti-sigma factor